MRTIDHIDRIGGQARCHQAQPGRETIVFPESKVQRHGVRAALEVAPYSTFRVRFGKLAGLPIAQAGRSSTRALLTLRIEKP